MPDKSTPILVLGATGQQGGSVAKALLAAGWPVRAMVRDPASPKAIALRRSGIELVHGDLNDADSVRTATAGVYGVFSVQTSSPGGQISDEDEVRYGITVANAAMESGVVHFVYSSGAGVGDTPTGVGHYDSKMRIEAHIRTLAIKGTVVRPVTFMELLVMPGFGLDEGRFSFFARSDQTVQVLAVQDIGRFVAAIFAEPARFASATLDIASDSVTGRDLEAAFTEAAGGPIPCARIPDGVLETNPFLGKLAALVDDGRLAGNADLGFLREINPEMLTFRSWLAGPGREAFQRALGTGGAWDYDKA